MLTTNHYSVLRTACEAKLCRAALKGQKDKVEWPRALLNNREYTKSLTARLCVWEINGTLECSCLSLAW